MKAFLSDHFELILGIIAVSVFAFQAFRILKKAKKIDVDANGVITGLF